MAHNMFIESRTVRVHGIKKRLRFDRRIWNGLDELCEREALTMDEFVSQAVNKYPGQPLKPVLEMMAVMYYRDAAEKSRADDPSVLEANRRQRRH